MYKKLLVPLDGSQLAEKVSPYVRQIAGNLDLEVIILHVCTEEDKEHATMHQAYVNQMAESMKCQLVNIKHKYKLKSIDNIPKVRGDLVIGYPAEKILSYAKKKRVDYILMATHGYSGIKKWTISSVADKILRSSKIPVFLIRPKVPQEITFDKWPRITLIVPLDGSELAESVLPYVETLAKQQNHKEVDIILLAVCERHSIPAELSEASQMYGWEEYVNQMMSESKKMYKQYLVGIEKNLLDYGLKVRSKILMGKAAQRINEFVRKEPFCLTVMATHGRTGYVMSDYGDVTNKVLREGTSPIFLVRTH
jgi:nucleotide-binding universal stress UspA family protein